MHEAKQQTITVDPHPVFDDNRIHQDEFLEWQIFRAFCELYRHRYGVEPASMVKVKWKEITREALVKLMPLQPKSNRDEPLPY